MVVVTVIVPDVFRVSLFTVTLVVPARSLLLCSVLWILFIWNSWELIISFCFYFKTNRSRGCSYATDFLFVNIFGYIHFELKF